jgi:hypothetical protein
MSITGQPIWPWSLRFQRLERRFFSFETKSLKRRGKEEAEVKKIGN